MRAPFGCRSPLAGEPFGLRRQMAGNPVVQPVVDLGGQIQQFDSHLSDLGEFLNFFPALLRLVHEVLTIWITDFNICYSISRD
jgi:hypothetical protein